jgi:hypothetical protein
MVLHGSAHFGSFSESIFYVQPRHCCFEIGAGAIRFDNGDNQKGEAMKLRDCVRWPRKKWRTTNDQDITPEQVSEHGVFETCRVSPQGLIIEIDYNGRAVSGRVGHSINAPNLDKLCDFLRAYSGDSMTTIENLDVEPDEW